MRYRLNSRPAFTLIEVLVVIAIIGILVGMLVPAVQKVRQSAARVQCANNLKQMALACHSIVSVNRGFPPSRTIYVTSGAKAGTLAQAGGAATNGHGWGVNLLPYIEQKNLYDSYQFYPSAKWGNWAWDVNQAVVSKPVEIYQCPATPMQNRTTVVSTSTPGFNTTNCNISPTSPGKAVYGDYFAPWSLTTTGLSGVGSTKPALDPYGNFVPLASFTDGLSNTILFNECAGRPDYYIKGKRQASNSNMSNPYWWGPWASFNAYALQTYSADGTKQGTACSINCNNSQGVYSFHSGGANFAFCDGSVRFISEGISALALMELFSRNGNEVVTDPNAY